jgi:hypothetical protein
VASNGTPSPADLPTSTARKGWSSAGLVTVGDNAGLWTAEQAAAILGPPILTPTQVRHLIRCASLQPAGKRRVSPHGMAGRHARVYKAEELIRLYDAVYGVTAVA